MKSDKSKGMSLIIIIIIAVLIIIDQLSKIIIYNNLSSAASGVPVIRGVLSLLYEPNTGISFSFLEGKRMLIILVTAIILFFMIYVLIRTPKTKYYAVFAYTLAVVVAGAAGNLIDRVIRGYVIDFFKLDFVNFAIFNIADICICVGLVVLIVLILVKYKDSDFDYVFHESKNR